MLRLVRDQYFDDSLSSKTSVQLVQHPLVAVYSEFTDPRVLTIAFINAKCKHDHEGVPRAFRWK